MRSFRKFRIRQSNSYDALVPEIQNPPDHGAAIWVFEVPTKPAVKVTR